MNNLAELKLKPQVRDSSRVVKLIVVAVIVCALLGALWLLPLKQYMVAVLEWTQGLGAWGPVFVVAFYVVATVFFLPGSVLTLGAGFLFGVPLGLATAWTGAVVGACAAFLLGRTLAREWVARKVSGNPKFNAIDEAVGREGFKIVFLLRLSPVFPFNLLNYSLGLTKVSFKHYALASMIGMLPAGLMYVYFGSAARSIADVAAGKVESGVAGQVFFWIGLVATILVAGFVTRLAKKSLKVAETAGTVGENIIEETEPAETETVRILPEDRYNRELVSNVRPRDWTNPEPAERYNLVVIGAGTAGLVTAAGAAGLGAKVALVERFLLGGDCLNVGCVPSKCLIGSSRVYGTIHEARGFGIKVPPGVDVDFPAVMERVRRLRARISHNDSAKRFKDLGVDVFLGHARFTGPEAVVVAGKTLRFKKAVIATGARAFNPSIPGLAQAGFFTNETVFSLTERPRRLAVIGGGPIGCEMAQAFRRLGCHVVLFHKNPHILDREDADAAEIVQKRFIEEGIELILDSDLKEVKLENGEKIVHYEVNSKPGSATVDEILVGAGRVPNVENLNLEAAGVQYDNRRGVVVNDLLQTANPNIYAAGDICMNHKFTHMADAAARIVIQNSLFGGSKKLSVLTVPWCTYTDPEIAHVGMYEGDAKKQGIAVDTYLRSFRDVDRAIADGEEEGFVKVHAVKGTDKILGATIVAAHAGDMISEITLAMVGKLGLKTISEVIHPYPTQAEAIKQAADAYNRTRLTPFVKRLFSYWLGWQR
ncbi:MAG: FAD-containing oxidoreductase [Desulfomonilaceae bacterium]